MQYRTIVSSPQSNTNRQTHRVIRSDSWKIATNSGDTCESSGSVRACCTVGESWTGPGMLLSANDGQEWAGSAMTRHAKMILLSRRHQGK